MLAAAIDGVRRATRTLVSADPEDIPKLEEALDARAQAIEHLAAAIREGAAPADGEIRELQALSELGAQVTIRLTLAKAALRHQLKTLDCEQQWLGSVLSTLPEPGSSLDVCG